MRLPVDPFAIADANEILYKENRSLASGISGCLMKVHGVFGIVYSTRFASEGFRRFTVAHELGHYFLDGHLHHLFGAGDCQHQSEVGFSSAIPIEREANAFAAALLMPKKLFKAASENAGLGLYAIEHMAALCQTSLTATAIRYATLTEKPVAVVCSTGQQIEFVVMSKALKAQHNLVKPPKGSSLPEDSLTSRWNRDRPNGNSVARRSACAVSLASWFDGTDATVQEEVAGLGESGRTLTVLSAESLPTHVPQAQSPSWKYGLRRSPYLKRSTTGHKPVGSSDL
jgi:hypothetical protein